MYILTGHVTFHRVLTETPISDRGNCMLVLVLVLLRKLAVKVVREHMLFVHLNTYRVLITVGGSTSLMLASRVFTTICH
jgi:hypothetical protein